MYGAAMLQHEVLQNKNWCKYLCQTPAKKHNPIANLRKNHGSEKFI